MTGIGGLNVPTGRNTDETGRLGALKLSRMSGVPEEIPNHLAEKLEFNPNYEVQDHHFVEVIMDAPRPFVPIRYIETELEMSRPGARNRIEELEDIDVIRSGPGAGGPIFWLKHEQSDWPIPLEVRVGPEDPEVTVSELWDREYVRAFAASGFFAIAEAILLSVGLTIVLFDPGLLSDFESVIVLTILLLALFAFTSFLIGGIFFARDHFGN